MRQMWPRKPDKNIKSLEGKGDVEMTWCPEMARWLSKVGTGRLEKEKTGRSKGEVMGCIGLGQ